MKKTLILATVCGLLASLAPPAFASDSPGTYIGPDGITLTQLALKESPTTFIIARSDNKVTDVTATLATSKPGADDTFLVKRIDLGQTGPGLITASHDKGKGLLMISSAMKRDNTHGGVLAFDTKAPQVGLDLKTAAVANASGLAMSTGARGVYST